MSNKDKDSWLPKTNQPLFKDLWAEGLKKSVKETHGHDGETCDEAHPDMSHEEWEATHDDHEGCSTCGESVITEEQLTEAMTVLNEKHAWYHPWGEEPNPLDKIIAECNGDFGCILDAVLTHLGCSTPPTGACVTQALKLISGAMGGLPSDVREQLCKKFPGMCEGLGVEPEDDDYIPHIPIHPDNRKRDPKGPWLVRGDGNQSGA
jgi:hypothetical protein